ncbi:hypothetical protein DW817_08150 [Acidaminococcus sp. AM33-14BH]|nr:hypothetical protein DW817_08150 [Acidaminococcus sp. AM33-14BH]
MERQLQKLRAMQRLYFYDDRGIPKMYLRDIH